MTPYTPAGEAHMSQLKVEQEAAFNANLAKRLAGDVERIAPGWMAWEAHPEGATHHHRGGLVVAVKVDADTGWVDEVTVVDMTCNQAGYMGFRVHHLATADLGSVTPPGAPSDIAHVRDLLRCIADRRGAWTERDSWLLGVALNLRDRITKGAT